MPVASQFSSLDLPAIDVFSFLFRRKDRPFPDDKVIYQDSDDLSRKYTFGEVHKAALDFGIGLKANYGVRKGDVIALFSPNDIDTPPATYGALWAGGIVSPANPGYTVAEFAYQLKDSGAKIVLSHLSALETVKKACAQAGISEENILILGATRDSTRQFKHWKDITSVEGTAHWRSPKVSSKEDPAFLVYSSGTTGRPKGVMLTHYNMTSNILQIIAGENRVLTWQGTNHVEGIPDGPPEGDKLLASLPFFHIYGLTCMVNLPIYSGIHTIVMAKFDIEKWCRLVQDEKVTFAYIVPPIALLLAKHPNVPKYDLSSMRMTTCGAAPLTRELSEAAFKRTGIRIKQGYGLSETSPTAFGQRWVDWQIGVGSVGWLLPNMEAKFCAIGAEDGPDGQAPKDLEVGETGELYLKGPNVFRGYWKNEAATAECLSPDGWFRTGDVGYLDKRGDLYITDRVKELIKYKGFQVPPAELEGYLVDNELVADACVVGVESVVLGTEVPRAYLVRHGGLGAVQPGDEKKIMDWLAAKVANHKKLRGGVKFVNSVPKSASGKILRRLLRDEAKKEFAELEQRQMKAKL